MKKLFTLVASLALMAMGHSALAQGNMINGQVNSPNYISTGMPIALIAPDALAAAMGDAGVASTPDAYSAHWNNAKFAFAENQFGISTTYTPWLRNLHVSDMNLLYLGGYYRINKRSAVAGSITYFSLGEIQSTDDQGNQGQMINPNEFMMDATYSMKLSDNLSLGATARYLRSDLTNGMSVNDGSGYVQTKAANSLATDVGLYFQQDLDAGQQFALGAFVSNLGAKFRYSDDDTETEFLPANLRVGGRYSYAVDNYNRLNFLMDFNKLLVPTPPVTIDGETYGSYDNLTDYHQTGVMQGALMSFYDAPGGLKEELQEVQISAGAEYWYNDMIAARAGYFYEHANKGGRQYATLGFGFNYSRIQVDFAYLIPTARFSNNPLSNTIRISLTLNMGKVK
ncbi:MAG: type IX secretion system outer membrane channel protein PorV [Bacteroidales bacterium]|nr:type IX secretion system outer membrane channel protein PorV [Bacteroidales bacterium]